MQHDKLQHITSLIEESQREALRSGRESYVESYRLAKIIADILTPAPTFKVVAIEDIRDMK
jgi:hypothetical protein